PPKSCTGKWPNACEFCNKTLQRKSDMALMYPFTNAPGPGQAFDIRPGIKWLRSPLPMSLNHINCYLLQDGDGWCVVDTGMNSDAARQQWLDVIETQLG